jgi:hypothetical protein
MVYSDRSISGVMLKRSGAFSSGVFAALAAGVVLLALFGNAEGGVSVATRFVARVAFVFFWLTYTGDALAVLFGSPFSGLARHRREFGLAFAGALLVHLALVAWLFDIAQRQPISNAWIVFFGLGALCTYALAVASLGRFSALWSSCIWRLFSTVALEYVAFLFFRDFALIPLQLQVRPIEYAPFAVLIILGALLRWIGAARRWRGYVAS